MNRDKDFNPASSARSFRNASTLPIPSGAWVKTLEMLANMTSADSTDASSLTQLDRPPQIAADELPDPRTAPNSRDRHTVYGVPRGRAQSDWVLGIVANGTLLVMLAWIVTGIEFLALIVGFVAAAYFTFAFAGSACPRRRKTIQWCHPGAISDDIAACTRPSLLPAHWPRDAAAIATRH